MSHSGKLRVPLGAEDAEALAGPDPEEAGHDSVQESECFAAQEVRRRTNESTQLETFAVKHFFYLKCIFLKWVSRSRVNRSIFGGRSVISSTWHFVC